MDFTNGHYPNSKTIAHTRLSNGITVLVYENFATPSIVVEGFVQAGALAETAVQAGLANLTSQLLMRGTDKDSFADIYDALESVGAEAGFGSGRHTISFGGSSLVEDADLLLSILASCLRNPTFPEKQVAQVQGQLMTALQMRANDTQQMAMLAFREAVYRDHPYGRSQLGYEETVPVLTRDDVVAFHKRRIGPQGMVVAVVGAVKAAAAIEKVTAVFGDWHVSDQLILPAVPDAPQPIGMIKTAVVIPDKSQADIVLGLPGPRRNDPDYLDASLMNTILGVFGMMGRIGQVVREEQGLAYYAYSRLNGGVGPNPWQACAGVAPQAVEQTVAAILGEIARLQNEPVPEDELADSQAYRIGSMPVGLETNSGLADVMTDIMLYDLGLDYLIQYPDLIRQITPAQIQAAAQKYLSCENIVVAVAGPMEERVRSK